MAKSYVEKMNRIQSERAAKAGLSENGVSEALSKMASSGYFPKGRVFVESDTTDNDGLRTLVFFDKAKDMWVFQQDINGKVQNRFEAPTRDEMYDAVRAYSADVSRQNDPEYLTCKRWLRESKWGRQFATFECLAAWQQLEKYVPAGGVTIENLDHAFTNILDLDDLNLNWHRFEQKRDRLTRKAEAAKLANIPHENLGDDNSANASVNARKNEDNANKQVPIKELRRRALFGGKVATVPSTGTVRQPR